MIYEVIEYYYSHLNFVMLKLWEHSVMFSLSWLTASITGFIIGVFVTRKSALPYASVIIGVFGALQSVPSIAVIAAVFIFLGIGMAPAVFALFVYSLVPVIFNTASSFQSITGESKEAAMAMGMNEWMILWKVEFPQALPGVFSGIRNAATINIATAAVASVIGAGGLGEIIYRGLEMMREEMIIAGALPVALFAVTVDFLLSAVEKNCVSKGIRLMMKENIRNSVQN